MLFFPVYMGSDPRRPLDSFSGVGSRPLWSYLHTGTLPQLISFVSRSYENCRVCTQNSHSGTRQSPLATGFKFFFFNHFHALFPSRCPTAPNNPRGIKSFYILCRHNGGGYARPFPFAPQIAGLNSGDEVAVGCDVSVGHARGVEGETGIAAAVEEDEAAGGSGAFGEEMDGFAGGEIGGGESARNVGGRVHAGCGPAEKIDGGFGQDDFHDGFAVAGAGDAADFGVSVAAAADERGIADAAGKFAACAAGGSGGEEVSVRIDGDSADSSL